MFLLTLIFGIVLLPKAYTLNCYECMPGLSGTCTETVKTCPSPSYQCGSVRVVSYAGALKVADINGKACSLPEECIKGSLNFGVSRTEFTTNCCTTSLCNTSPAPEPTRSAPNGKKCFSCVDQTCTTTLNCEGDEDYCISTTVTAAGQKLTMKGCASKAVCSSTTESQMMGTIGGDISCCQGNFCNSASITRAGLLLLLAPLISLVKVF